MHQVQVDIVETESLQRVVNGLLNAVVPRIVELGRHPNFFPGYAGIFDASADLRLIAIGKGSAHISQNKKPGTRTVGLTYRCDGTHVAAHI